MKNKKEITRIKRHRRLRLNLSGTKERLRLVVHRSLKNLYSQLIDDSQNKIILSGSTTAKEIRQKLNYWGNRKAAEFFGLALGKKIKEKGINKIVFDRGGYLYHGRVKSFADGLRKAGLEF